MIRVLHVVTYMGRGGLETMIMNYYRKIDRSQVQFDFLTHRDFKADYDEEITRLGGRIYHLPQLDPFSKKYHQLLTSFFQSHPEYRIIHVHQDCMSSVILKDAYQCGVPVRIAHSHSSSQDKNIKYLIKIFYKQFIPKYATELFACSDAAGQWMFGSLEYEVLNNAIDAEKYIFNPVVRKEMRHNLEINEDEIVLGHVGRFSFPKNHDFLVDIFSCVSRKIKAKLLLVGDGDLRSSIERKVKALGISDKVIFTGLRTDVNDLLQAMDVFVFPSHYEGLPVTLVEAQASGLPCVISNMVPKDCKITDLVEDISLSKKADVWAERICSYSDRIANRKNTYTEIKNSGFDIKENAEKLTKTYIELWK